MKNLTTHEGAKKWLTANYPPIAGGLIGPGADEQHLELAREVYQVFLAMAEMDQKEVESCLESFAQMSFDFIRLQSRFMRSGRYEANCAKDILQKLYLDEQRMQEYYLDGLLLTYAFWPNHLKLLEFFRDDFLSSLSRNSCMLEIGVGHGLMSNMAFATLPGCHYTGLDISPSSLSYARHLWRANGTDHSDTVVEVADVVSWAPPEGGEGTWDAVICCEVLEHVERPDAVLETLRRSLKKDGTAFITTVANVAAEDHIHLFSNAKQIRELCAGYGLPVAVERIWPLKGFDNEPLPLNYAAILRRGNN